MNALEYIQATVEPAAVDLKSVFRGLQHAGTVTKFKGTRLDAYRVGKLFLILDKTEWDDNRTLYGLSLSIDMDGQKPVVSLLYDGVPLFTMDHTAILAMQEFARAAVKLEAGFQTADRPVVVHRLITEFCRWSQHDYQREPSPEQDEIERLYLGR